MHDVLATNLYKALELIEKKRQQQSTAAINFTIFIKHA